MAHHTSPAETVRSMTPISADVNDSAHPEFRAASSFPFLLSCDGRMHFLVRIGKSEAIEFCRIDLRSSGLVQRSIRVQERKETDANSRCRFGVCGSGGRRMLC